MRLPVLALAMLATFASVSQTLLHAQAPAPAPSPTIWRFLGITQLHEAVHAKVFNHFGHHPGLEPKVGLKPLADPANLASKYEALKVAAEIKQAEDLAPQKKKAIRYLASIGCGCYDKEKAVTKALVAAMSDCTEDVRLVAIEEIEKAASGESCDNCSQVSCCGKEISEMLAQIAYALDDTGCFLEPSERVREAAESALGVCCPGIPPPIYSEEREIEGTLDPPPSIEGLEAPLPDGTPSDQEAFLLRDNSYANNGLRASASSRRTDSAAPGLMQPASVASGRVSAGPVRASISSGPAPKNIAMIVDPDQNIAKVHFRSPIKGEQLKVWSSTANGYRLDGRLEVFAVSGDVALVRPLGNLELASLRRGTLVARSSD